MMRNAFPLLFLLLFITWSCKKKEEQPTPVNGAELIVGTWRLVSYQTFENEEVVWREPETSSLLTFRYDGVMLDSDGLPSCCLSTRYIINGSEFKVQPLSPLPENPVCALVYCTSCEAVDISVSGDEMKINFCAGTALQERYERMP